MFGFILGLILLVIGIGTTIYLASYKKVEEAHYKKDKWGEYEKDVEGNKIFVEAQTTKPLKKYSGVSFFLTIIVAVVCIFSGCITKVNTGNVGVIKTFGKIEDKVLAPGLNFKAPWNKVVSYDSTVQQLKITTQAYSKDGQTMDLEVYLQYQVQQDKLIVKDNNGKVIQSEGIAGKYVTLQSLQDRIETQCIEKTKAVMSSAEAMTIIEKRSDYSALVSETVREAIGQDYYVNVQDVVLTDISFTDEFEKIVEDKVAAQQETLKAEAEAKKKEIDAEAAKKVAELEADAKLYQATKEAEALLVKAEAEADALKLEKKAVADSINQLISDLGLTAEQATKLYEYLIWTDAWDGDVPTVTDSSSGYIMLP